MSNDPRGIREWQVIDEPTGEILATGNYLGRVYTQGDKAHAKLASEVIFERNTKHVTQRLEVALAKGEFDASELQKRIKAQAYTKAEAYDLAIGTTQDYIVTSKGNTMHV